MELKEAQKLVKDVVQAAIACYRANNEPSRLSGVKAAQRENQAIWKLLTALTDAPVTAQDVQEVA